jgi:hypothetical protein
MPTNYPYLDLSIGVGIMKRADDIKQKLAFSLLKYNSLQDEINVSQKQDAEIAFIGQKTGEILSACRECFDYCAKDMADTFVSQSTNQRMVSRYLSGVAKAYFPFFRSQLSRGALFYELTTTAPALHAHLLDLASKIEAKEVMPGRQIGYDVCTALNDLVNNKKHDQITTAKVRGNAATRLTFPGGVEITVSPAFPVTDRPDFSADLDAPEMIGSGCVQITYVREYKLSHNNWEVGRFCRHSIQATKHILSDIYQQFFGLLRDYLDPWETIKPEDLKRGEALLRSISPIISRPVRVALLLDDVESANIEITFEGTIKATDATDISLAKLFMLIFEKSFNFRVQTEIHKFILENWKMIDSNDRTPRYYEVTNSLNQKKNITINGLADIEFNKIVWGILSKFCCGENVLSQQGMDGPSIQAAIAIINSNASHFSLSADVSGQPMNCQIL